MGIAVALVACGSDDDSGDRVNDPPTSVTAEPSETTEPGDGGDDDGGDGSIVGGPVVTSAATTEPAPAAPAATDPDRIASWVAVGNPFDEESATSTGTVWVSDDGIAWETAAELDVQFSDVTYGDGRFVAVGSTADWLGGAISWSEDGYTWSEPIEVDNDLHAVGYGDGRWMAAGVPFTGDTFNEVIAHVSDDAETWEAEVLFSAEADWVSSVAHGADGRWIVTTQIALGETGMATMMVDDADEEIYDSPWHNPLETFDSFLHIAAAGGPSGWLVISSDYGDGEWDFDGDFIPPPVQSYVGQPYDEWRWEFDFAPWDDLTFWSLAASPTGWAALGSDQADGTWGIYRSADGATWERVGDLPDDAATTGVAVRLTD